MTAPLDDLRDYLDASPSPYHAARSATDRLDEAGFIQIAIAEAWDELPLDGYVVVGATVVAWRTNPNAAASDPFRLVGAHTDSPCLRIKPRPDEAMAGFKQLNIEVYGGILNNSWLDRDLGIAGRLSFLDGSDVDVVVDRPIARVPQLAVHLDRGVNEEGLKLDRQQHLRPVWGSGTSTQGEFADWIAAEAGCARPDFWDLSLFDTQRAAIIGGDSSLLASGRLDNQASCWAATSALLSATPTIGTAMIVLNDHEEVGSSSTTGAGGPLLEWVLERHVAARGGDRDDLVRSLSRSLCVSADNAHAIHPNYVDRHDTAHGPIVNRGPAIKINSNQRYATTPQTAAVFAAACDATGVPHQVFVGRNDLPCGSTIGPITSTRLGIPTIDVGIPQLSMHSARELCGVDDPPWLATALVHMLSNPST